MKMRVFHIVVLLLNYNGVYAQGCDNIVSVYDNTGQQISSGIFLEDTLIPDEFFNMVTVTYGDTVYGHSNSGQLGLVERLMDIYYPLPELTLLANTGDTIKQLPVMFLLHAKNGQKESMIERVQGKLAYSTTLEIPPGTTSFSRKVPAMSGISI